MIEDKAAGDVIYARNILGPGQKCCLDQTDDAQQTIPPAPGGITDPQYGRHIPANKEIIQ